jgi:hypothetical protein
LAEEAVVLVAVIQQLLQLFQVVAGEVAGKAQGQEILMAVLENQTLVVAVVVQFKVTTIKVVMELQAL